jgi:hypothetical protein
MCCSHDGALGAPSHVSSSPSKALLEARAEVVVGCLGVRLIGWCAHGGSGAGRAWLEQDRAGVGSDLDAGVTEEFGNELEVAGDRAGDGDQALRPRAASALPVLRG